MNNPNTLKDGDSALVDILRSSMAELDEQSPRVYQRLIQHARENFFEQHQTPGRIRSLADELLTELKEGNEDNENRPN